MIRRALPLALAFLVAAVPACAEPMALACIEQASDGFHSVNGVRKLAPFQEQKFTALLNGLELSIKYTDNKWSDVYKCSIPRLSERHYITCSSHERFFVLELDKLIFSSSFLWHMEDPKSVAFGRCQPVAG